MRAKVSINYFDDEDSADFASGGSAICGFARPLQSGLSENSILRGRGVGEYGVPFVSKHIFQQTCRKEHVFTKYQWSLYSSKAVIFGKY